MRGQCCVRYTTMVVPRSVCQSENDSELLVHTYAPRKTASFVFPVKYHSRRITVGDTKKSWQI